MTARYPLTDTNPVPIYPGGKQDQVTIYCDSDNDCYVSQVASGLYPIPLGGRQSIRWDGKTPLYAFVTDAALPSAVLVIDSGVVLPTGRVTVNGPLTVADILAPVSVQGGAELLFLDSGTLAPGGLQELYIPAYSPSGLSYQGLFVSLSNAHDDASVNRILTYTLGNTTDEFNVSGSLIVSLNDVYLPFQTNFSIPANMAPIDPGTGVLSHVLTLECPATSPGDTNWRVTVFGIATAPQVPVTDLTSNVWGRSAFNVPASGASQRFYLPPSYTPYGVTVVARAGSSTGTIDVGELNNGGVVTTTIPAVPGLSSATEYNFYTMGSGNVTTLTFNSVTGAGVYVIVSKTLAPRNFKVYDEVKILAAGPRDFRYVLLPSTTTTGIGVLAFSTVITTGAGGYFDVVFPHAFVPGEVPVVNVSMGDFTGYYPSTNDGNTTATFVRIYLVVASTGAIAGAGAVARLNITATGRMVP